MDAAAYRDQFPIASERTYLISASLGPLSTKARAAAEEHLDLWQALGPEELWFDHALPRLERCRASFARQVGAGSDEIAVIPSVSSGLSSIASCLDLEQRPKIVLTEMDFPTNHYVWRAQERAGAKLDIVASPDGIRIDPEEMASRIDDQTALVNVNRVLFESSWIIDLEPIVAAARRFGALVCVDDFHGTGIVPLDVRAAGVDLLVTGVLKWVCGGQGLALLYCRRELVPELQPRVVGWFGTKDFFDFDRSGLRLRDDARRFETGTFPLPQAWTASAALELIEEVGVERIRARNQELSARVIEHADEAGLEVLSPRAPGQRGGLVRVRIPGGRDRAREVLHLLFEKDVVLDSRHDAFRISPHFFNDEEDVDRCFAELGTLL